MFDNLFAKYQDVKAERENGEGGFTLIELLVVVVIIGVLVAIAIPLYLNYQANAKEKSIKADIRNAVTAVQQCYNDNNNTMPASLTLTGTGPLVGATVNGQNLCANDKITMSGDTTKSLAYVLASDSKTYTITASDNATATSGTSFQYTSNDGNIAKTPATPAT